MRLSLHMMVLNASKTIERVLRPLAGIVDQVCVTDTGSTDGTREVMIDTCEKLNIPRLHGVSFTYEACPERYFIDEQATFKYRFPDQSVFTGLPQLRDWALARNLSLFHAKGKYVIRLDADDEVLIPENIPKALDVMDSRGGIDFVMAPYEIYENGEFSYATNHHFIWRNRADRLFEYALHEHIPGRLLDGSNVLIAQQGLLFRDWRDSVGTGVRVPHRNFKVLLLEYERCLAKNIPVEGYIRLTLADEAVAVSPSFAIHVLGRLEDFPQAQGWAHFIRGECYRRMGDHFADQAMEEYELSAIEGDLRGMMELGFLQHRTGVGDFRATITQCLTKRRTAMSCLIPITRIKEACLLLEEVTLLITFSKRCP
jgi:glycosyltransferase involved in cell wall biosynthesis